MAERDTNYFRGAWSAGIAAGTSADPLGVTGTYRQRELVTHDGHLWINLQDSGDDDSNNNTGEPGGSGVTTWENLGSTALFEDTVLNLDTMGNVTIDSNVVSETATLVQRQEAVRAAINASVVITHGGDVANPVVNIVGGNYDAATDTLTIPTGTTGISQDDADARYVQYNEELTGADALTTAQQLNARTNIGAGVPITVAANDGLVLDNNEIRVNHENVSTRWNRFRDYGTLDTVFIDIGFSTDRVRTLWTAGGSPTGSFPEGLVARIPNSGQFATGQFGRNGTTVFLRTGVAISGVVADSIIASDDWLMIPTSNLWSETGVASVVLTSDQTIEAINGAGTETIDADKVNITLPTATTLNVPNDVSLSGQTLQLVRNPGGTDPQVVIGDVDLSPILNNDADLPTELSHLPTSHNYGYTAITVPGLASAPPAPVQYANLGGPQIAVRFAANPTNLTTGTEVFLFSTPQADLTNLGEADYHLVVQRDPFEFQGVFTVHFTVNRGTRTSAAATTAVANGFYSRVPLGSAVNELIQTVSGGTTSYEWMTRSTGTGTVTPTYYDLLEQSGGGIIVNPTGARTFALGDKAQYNSCIWFKYYWTVIYNNKYFL